MIGTHRTVILRIKEPEEATKFLQKLIQNRNEGKSYRGCEVNRYYRNNLADQDDYRYEEFEGDPLVGAHRTVVFRIKYPETSSRFLGELLQTIHDGELYRGCEVISYHKDNYRYEELEGTPDQ